MRSIARLTLAFATAFATVFSFPALSQDVPGQVGRIAYIEGTVAIYQEPDEGWERAYVNSPVSNENSVWTEPSSRAEVRVGGTAVRLEEATQLDITRLDINELDAFVPRGTVSLRVRHFDRNERLIFNTPHARFAIRANGRYRIDVDPDRDESRLTVFAGEARVGSESGRLRVQAGKTVRVFGGSSPSYVVETAFRDPFDRWSETRDTGWVESRSLKYVSASMTGYEDLDRYGNWREEPEFGALWYPTRVAADWAPYRHGRWDYVRPWGWTWIDDAPWGYAPFHYGRWVFVRDRWAWTPGRREARPTWAPALVAWVGGSNLSVGVSSGSPSVGWYPLSPWDRYQPWYNASPTYVNQVNVIVRDSPPRDDRRVEWRELSRERGVTVVNRSVVVDSRPVQQAVVAVRPEVARQVQIAAPATVLPTRNEVIQRRQSVRTQVVTPATAPATTPGSAPATQRPGTAQTPPAQRGERAGPAARPEFQRRQAAAPPAPEPAKAAPPPAQRVGPPTAAAQQQSREEMLKAREAAVLKTREEQQKAREGEAKGRQDQKSAREAEQEKAREQQKAQRQKVGEEQMKARAEQQKAADEQRKAREEQMKGREAEQQKAREEQMKGRDAEQQKAREQQKAQQQKVGEEQLKARAEQQKAADEQRKAREEQMKGREAEQQKAREQQQKAREDQQKAREAEQQKARAEQQKALDDQKKAREDQMRAREAEQQKARAEQQKALEDQKKAREEQQKGRVGQQQPQQQQQQQQGAPKAPSDADAKLSPRESALKRQAEKKEREDKEKEDEEKKGKAGR